MKIFFLLEQNVLICNTPLHFTIVYFKGYNSRDSFREEQDKLVIESERGYNIQNTKSIFRETIVDAGLAFWKSPFTGLAGSITRTLYHIEYNTVPLRVMGISRNSTTLDPLVAKQLKYSSAQATRVLRRCFVDVAGKA